ncbi:MAG TPA: hypothetical protein VNT31_09655 [Nocardioides sp.]|nr:hypothetical protein [Nocardioides sp.]
MKKIARRTAFAAAALIASLGIVALPTAAEADTGWGWRVAPTERP